MGRKRIVVLGASSGGYATALALKDRLRARADVTVIARTDQFVFVPSLPLLALGLRTEAQTAFSVAPRFAQAGIAFRAEPALRLDLHLRRVTTRSGEAPYDFLVIATGGRPNYGAIPGLGPRGYTHSVTTLAQAQLAREAFLAFLNAPGPAVIGDVQGSMGRAQGLVLAHEVARALRSRGSTASVTHLTAGPPMHNGEVASVANASVAEVTPGEIRLRDGRVLPFVFSILLPPFLGVDLIRALPRITDAAGFVRVNAYQQSPVFPEVFAAGAAVAGDDDSRNGERTEQHAQLVAANIEAAIAGQPLRPDEGRPARPEAEWEAEAYARYFG